MGSWLIPWVCCGASFRTFLRLDRGCGERFGAAASGVWADRSGEALSLLGDGEAMAGKSLRTEPPTHGARVKAGWMVVTMLSARR